MPENDKHTSCKRERTVIHVVQHLQPGGIENLVLDLQRHSSRKNQVYIASLEGTRERAIINWPILENVNENIFFLNKPQRWSIITLMKLMLIFLKLRVDVVHSHHIGPLIYAGLAAKIMGKSVIHTEHDAWHLNDEHQCKLEGWILSLVKPLVVADADYVATELKSKFPYMPVVVIHNGVNTNNFVLGDKKDAFKNLGVDLVNSESDEPIQLIGCAARLEPVKGHSVLIKAVSELPKSVHLLIAGAGSEEKVLKELASVLGVSERVHFLGHVDDMVSFYQSLDIFCLPSLNEGFPLSPLEAQACGIPVVVSNVGGCKEVVCPDTGVLVVPNNSNLLVQLLTSQLARLSNISPSLLSRKFVFEGKTLDQMVKAYNHLVERSHHSIK